MRVGKCALLTYCIYSVNNCWYSMAQQKDRKPDDISLPDLAGYGSIIDIVFANGRAIGLKINDFLRNENSSIFDLDEKHNLTEAFVEMKAIGMPLAVVDAPAGSATRYCFIGALPRKVVFVEELTIPKRLEGKFSAAFGTEFVVSGTNPNYPQIKERLEKSFNEKTKYWIVVAVGHTQQQLIIDVLELFEQPHCVIGEPFHDEFDEVGFAPITPEIATEIFDSFESTSPTSGPLTGIPFQYVFDGCEDRSHQMVNQILARKEHIQPIKLWAFPNNGLFKFKTANSPLNCEVLWAYHTAPALMTTCGVLVIDPSTGSGPESVATWYGRFKTSKSKLYYTSHHVYLTRIDHCKVFMSDPQYLISDFMLRVYRIHLRLQSCLYGAPPYTCS